MRRCAHPLCIWLLTSGRCTLDRLSPRTSALPRGCQGMGCRVPCGAAPASTTWRCGGVNGHLAKLLTAGLQMLMDGFFRHLPAQRDCLEASSCGSLENSLRRSSDQLQRRRDDCDRFSLAPLLSSRPRVPVPHSRSLGLHALVHKLESQTLFSSSGGVQANRVAMWFWSMLWIFERQISIFEFYFTQASIG